MGLIYWNQDRSLRVLKLLTIDAQKMLKVFVVSYRISTLKTKRPASHSWSGNLFLRCLLKKVKTQLRVPKIQRATFLNNIVTANTDFS